MTTKTTTVKNLTDAQIAGVRAEANDAGDDAMVAVCIVAQEGSISVDDFAALDVQAVQAAAKMTREQAYAAVVRAINNAEAQSE